MLRFTLRGKDAFCNLCGVKMVTKGTRNGTRCLECPRCGLTFRVGKSTKDSVLFPTRGRKKGEEDGG